MTSEKPPSYSHSKNELMKHQLINQSSPLSLSLSLSGLSPACGNNISLSSEYFC